jgi:hypothetical protein
MPPQKDPTQPDNTLEMQGEKRFRDARIDKRGNVTHRKTHLAFVGIELRRRASTNADFLFDAGFGPGGYQITAPFERLTVWIVPKEEANLQIAASPPSERYVVLPDDWLAAHRFGDISPTGAITLRRPGGAPPA